MHNGQRAGHAGQPEARPTPRPGKAFEGLFASSRTPFALLDEQLNIVAANTSLRSIIGDGARTIQPDSPECESSPSETAFSNAAKLAFSQCFSGLRPLLLRDGSGTLLCFDCTFLHAAQPGGALLACFLHEAGAVTLARCRQARGQYDAMVSRLLSAITHDLNNTLAALVGFAHLLAEEVPEPVKQDVAHVSSVGLQFRDIIARFASLGRKVQVGPGEVDVNELILGTLSVLAPELEAEGIRCRVELAGGLPRVKGDASLLEPCLVILIENARRATSTGGLLIVSTGTVDLPENSALAGAITSIEQESGDVIRPFAVISVSDSGRKPLPADLIELFDPCYSTPDNRFMGLGMSTCRRIMEHHGGVVHASKAAGGGLTVGLCLPAAGRLEAAVAGVAEQRSVLVVDDGACGGMLSTALGKAGYVVKLAGNGLEAESLLERFCFDVVVTDVKLPYLDGRQLFERLVKKDAALARKFVFVTGERLNGKMQQFLGSLPNACITKPFEVDDVLAAVRQVAQQRRDVTG